MPVVVLSSLSCVVGFCAALYVAPSARNVNDALRDSPRVVVSRCAGIAVVSLVGLRVMADRRNTGMLSFLARCTGVADGTALTAIRRCLVPTATLFAGVIVCHACDTLRAAVREATFILGEEYQRAKRRADAKSLPAPAAPAGFAWVRATATALPRLLLRNLSSAWGTRQTFLCSLRTFVVAPFAEEVVLRLCVVDNARWAAERFPAAPDAAFAATRGRLIALSAVMFGLAHVHHGYRFYITAHERFVLWAAHNHATEPAAEREAMAARYARKEALGRMAGIFGITFTFGLLGGWLLLNVGENVLASYASHALCNVLGAPSLDFLVEDRTDLVPGKSPAGIRVSKRLVAVERAVIVGSYVAGVVGFVACVRRGP